MKKRIRQQQNHKSRADYSQLLQNFLEDKRLSGLSEATLKGYRYSVDYLLAYLNGQEITEETYKRYISSMMDKGISLNSVNHYIRCDRAFLYWAMDVEAIPEFQIKTVRVQETIKEVYSPEELGRLIEQPKMKDGFTEWRTWAIINFILGTAARESTVCYMRMGDVSFADRTVVFRHLKNKRVQILPLSEALERVLKKYISMWRYDATETDFLFPSVYGEQLTDNALKHAQKKYNNRRGVTKTSVHLLRHSFVKNWCLAGGNLFKLQRVLGHSTLTMTQHYANLYSSDLQGDFNEYAVLDKLQQKQRKTVKRKNIR